PQWPPPPGGSAAGSPAQDPARRGRPSPPPPPRGWWRSRPPPGTAAGGGAGPPPPSWLVVLAGLGRGPGPRVVRVQAAAQLGAERDPALGVGVGEIGDAVRAHAPGVLQRLRPRAACCAALSVPRDGSSGLQALVAALNCGDLGSRPVPGPLFSFSPPWRHQPADQHGATGEVPRRSPG